MGPPWVAGWADPRFNLILFKATIKSWGHSDAKNYYESDNACSLDMLAPLQVADFQ